VVAVEALLAVDDLRPAQWLIDNATGFPHDVGSLLPTTFGTYARVFHPAYNGIEKVSWAHIAHFNKKMVHPHMQFSRLLGYASRFAAGYRDSQQDLFDAAPKVGDLPAVTADAVARTLARHTAGDDRCWYAVWNGWGQRDLQSKFHNRPTFELPGRAYYLARGPLAAVGQSAGVTPTGHVPCSLWWPDDHAWCVATDIDLDSTYIGGSGACIEELLTDPEIEVAQVNPVAGIGANSDTLNLVEPE
jgi:hypothetical protein